MGCCSNHPNHDCLAEDEGCVWGFGLQKPSSAEDLMSSCGNLEDSFRRNADDRGLICMFQKEVKTLPWLFMWYFGLKSMKVKLLLYPPADCPNRKCWFSGVGESAAINKRPASPS